MVEEEMDDEAGYLALVQHLTAASEEKQTQVLDELSRESGAYCDPEWEEDDEKLRLQDVAYEQEWF